MSVDPSERESLRSWRLNKGWTQKQAAEQLGLNLRSYTRMEAGERSITRRTWRMVELIEGGD